MTGSSLSGHGKLAHLITLYMPADVVIDRVVVNYADYGLQFFTSNGTFYVELSLGVRDDLKSASQRVIII